MVYYTLVYKNNRARAEVGGMNENVLRTHDFMRFGPFPALVITKETKVATFSSIAKAHRHGTSHRPESRWKDNVHGGHRKA